MNTHCQESVHGAPKGSGLSRILRLSSLVIAVFVSAQTACAAEPCSQKSTVIVCLDGAADWRVAFDPKNVGREEKWWQQPQPTAKCVRVPGVYQEVLPECHGVAWYWRDVVFPACGLSDGRYLLRFWMVDYLADVWVNDVHVGRHEGGEEAFTLDVTGAAKPGAVNRIAVRVLSPSDEPIDGLTLKNTPQRGRRCKPTCGSEYQGGGLVDSVELLVCPAVRIEDLVVRPNHATGEIRLSVNVRNAGKATTADRLHLTVAPASSGVTFAATDITRSFAPGDTQVETTLTIAAPHLWNLNDPYLYRVTARISSGTPKTFDELSTRCGFRDFRFTDGAFRLNGKRLFLKGSFTGNMGPAGYKVPLDPGLLRRDLLNSKVMGMNMIRFFGSIARRYQLDLCDEIGFLVYEETAANWLWDDSPQMAERFDTSIRGMIHRDRNHPSVVMWGLLNETRDGPIFRYAVGMLPFVHSLDDTRVTMLNSGLEQFVPRQKVPRQGFGALCNPGSTAWQDSPNDSHPYQRSPHLPAQIAKLRDTPPDQPVLISEYGVSSAVDLLRQVRHYEQIGCEASEDSQLYRGFLDQFMVDWKRWNMAQTFGSPENYFRQCVAKMAGLREQGLNTIRANPMCVGHLMTGTYDHGFLGEGVATTEFRDFKPGAADALFEGFYPLRLCLFAEPPHAYRGARVRFEAVLANEDALLPGQYPIHLQVIGPDKRRVFEKTVTVNIQDPKARHESAMAIPIFGEDIVVDGPTGKYQFQAAFERGGAATGGNTEFHVTDPADMPKIETDVALWGDDPTVTRWLTDHAIKTHPLSAGQQTAREVILVGRKPAAGDASAWQELARHMARGSIAIFPYPGVFKKGENPIGWVPLANKGTLNTKNDWLYPHDQWFNRHPIADGLPSGTLMDYTFYRDIISDSRWAGLDVPAELVAACINTSNGYDSGTLMAVYRFGAGRFVLNTLWIGEQLGHDPVAEHLLRNLIRYAAAHAAGPAADLPSGFGGQLKAIGYEDGTKPPAVPKQPKP